MAVADNELALAASDRDHRVDGLDTGLKRLGNRLAVDDAGGDQLQLAERVAGNRALVIDRLTERVDDTAKESHADRNFDNAPRLANRIAFFNELVVADDDGADRVLLQVERETHDVVGELEELSHLAAGQAIDAGDAVAHLQHAADVLGLNLSLEFLKLLAEDIGDFFGSNAGH